MRVCGGHGPSSILHFRALLSFIPNGIHRIQWKTSSLSDAVRHRLCSAGRLSWAQLPQAVSNSQRSPILSWRGWLPPRSLPTLRTHSSLPSHLSLMCRAASVRYWRETPGQGPEGWPLWERTTSLVNKPSCPLRKLPSQEESEAQRQAPQVTQQVTGKPGAPPAPPTVSAGHMSREKPPAIPSVRAPPYHRR